MFVGVHLIGVGEALKVMFAITALAVVALVVFVLGMIPEFSASNLTDIKPDTSKSGASDFLPFGYAGALSAFVYGIWFFLAVEGRAARGRGGARPEEATCPRGIIVAMLILLVFAALMLTLAPGGAGSQTIMDSDNPLPLAADTALGDGSFIGEFVNYAGLAGLIASFFSIIYAYSRQLFALSRAGYFPRALSVTSGRRVPHIALDPAGRHRLPARGDHRGRRADDPDRGVRRDGLLRAHAAQPHHPAPQGARPGAAVHDARRHADLGRSGSCWRSPP